ncbi:LOW QUALITY PROTEIN: hypothetical protein HJC23_010852, partial [Cyclotella cryptica]
MSRSNRNLQAFSTLNSIFSKVTLVLPDSRISSNGLDLTITELMCSDLSIQDVQGGNTSLLNTTKRISVNIIGVEITCSFDGATNGPSSMEVRLAGQYEIHHPRPLSILTLFRKISMNSLLKTINDCNAVIEIGDLEFDGDGLGFIVSILNTFEGLLRNRIEEEVDTAVCSELKGLVVSYSTSRFISFLVNNLRDGSLDNVLLKISNNPNGYLEPLPDNVQDPLFLENSMIIPRGNSFIGGSEANEDMSINSFIHDNFLDDNHKFVLDPSIFMSSNVIFADILTETTMSTESIELCGLDTFTELDLMSAIGNCTLRNSLTLETLSLVVNMNAFMKRVQSFDLANTKICLEYRRASSQSDAVISASNLSPIDEKFTVAVTQNGISIDLSAMLALNTEALGNLTLGPLLHTESMLQCIMSAAEDLSFTEVSISVLEVVPPTLTGFLDAGIDNIISKGAVELFDMYENVLIKALPNFFQVFVREKLNAFLDDALQLLNSCESKYLPMNEYIDFWDLLLAPEVASSNGGSGGSPYGSIVSWVWELVQEQLFSSDSNGLLAINDVVVRPYTLAQSGEPGLMSFNQAILDLNKKYVKMDIWRAFANNLRLGLSDLRFNISGNILENHISLGIGNKSLEADIRLDIKVGSPETSPLATSNSVDLKISIPSIEVIVDLFAMIETSRLTTTPLRNVPNLNCWFSIIHQSNITNIDASKKTVVSISSEIIESDWMSGILDSKREAASLRCLDPSYDSLLPKFGKHEDILHDGRTPPFRASQELVDGVLYGSMAIVQIIAIVLAQKHADYCLMSNVLLDVPQNATLVDFTNLSTVVSWADLVLDKARGYLGRKHQNKYGDHELGIINILQAFLLDDDSLLTIPITDQGFAAGGVVLSLYNVTLIGLDSFTSFSVLSLTGPQTFNNYAKLETLGVSVDMGLSIGDSNETVMASLILKDVELDVSLLMAIDQEILGSLKLGSVMHTSDIFFCILSVIHTVVLSRFVMDIGDIESFSLSGFVTDSTDNSIKNFTQSLLTKIGTRVHYNVYVNYVEMGKSRSCTEPEIVGKNEMIDFRNLFLSHERSVELLGTGSSEYGDLFRILFNFIEQSTSMTNNKGLLMINNVLVSKLTEDGDMNWQGKISSREMEIALNGLNAVTSLAIKDVQISNLDSLASLVRVLQPIKGESSNLNNTARIGLGLDQLQVTFTLFVSREGNKLQVKNELDLGLSLYSAGLVLGLLAKIKQ